VRADDEEERMELAIGLPNSVAGTKGNELVEWARAAESAGFSSLGTIDRVVYDSYESLIALAGAAAVTERIRLTTDIVLGPLRPNPALLAKQVLSLDALAGGGRAVLGIAIGGREDDYEVSGIPMSERGERLDAALEEIRKVWDGEGEPEAKVGPRPRNGGPGLLVGGAVEASFRRAARFGDGWTMGGGTPEQFGESLEKLKAAWKEAGREGEPRKVSLGYFALGPNAQQAAEHDLADYYAWLGEEVAGMIVQSAAKDADTVKGYLAAFEQLGCDEFFFFPCSSDPKQVELLAEAAGL
jgi:alkanesulfonate monooxygenase SsuD/methylene tetrahydromethanopterin reductase-like flavin-dependent oxidoreductase (luciferase family)